MSFVISLRSNRVSKGGLVRQLAEVVVCMPCGIWCGRKIASVGILVGTRTRNFQWKSCVGAHLWWSVCTRAGTRTCACICTRPGPKPAGRLFPRTSFHVVDRRSLSGNLPNAAHALWLWEPGRAGYLPKVCVIHQHSRFVSDEPSFLRGRGRLSERVDDATSLTHSDHLTSCLLRAYFVPAVHAYRQHFHLDPDHRRTFGRLSHAIRPGRKLRAH